MMTEDRVFWTVLVEGTNGGANHQHITEDGARKEAERLAMLPDNRGKNVYLMQCLAVVNAPPSVIWRQLSDVIPF